MATKTIEVERVIPAEPEVVFALLKDAASWPTWTRFDRYESERAGDPDPDGVGTIRNFHRGRRVSRELVVAADAPEHFAYELLSGLPIEGYRADVRLRPDAGGTALSWRSTFTPKVAGTGWFYRAALQHFIGQVVDDLTAHLAGARAA